MLGDDLMASPEFNIANRTLTILKTMAANNTFVASEGERVRPVKPEAIRIWKVVDGGNQLRASNGLQNLILPGIRISILPVESTIGAGLNCADDEVHRIAIQFLDSSPYQTDGPIRTYTDWMVATRLAFTTVPNPFLQDADPAVYDPYVVHPLKRVPAEAQSLIRHEQQVAMFTFQVMVRNHR